MVAELFLLCVCCIFGVHHSFLQLSPRVLSHSYLSLSTSKSITNLPEFYYTWNNFKIRYTTTSDGDSSNPPIVLIHGFGASLDYYREQIPVFADSGYDVYAIDLLGFGKSDKIVDPLGKGYSAELWAQLVLDFVDDIIMSSASSGVMRPRPVLVGNSIGSRIALQAALQASEKIRGLLLFNAAAGINNKFVITDELTPLSLKLFAVPLFGLLDILLKNQGFSTWFFERTKKPENIRATLQSVYVNKERCDDALVKSISFPAEDPNSLKVFVEILTNDAGATPDAFIDRIKMPIKLIWGDDDPFTPLSGPYGLFFQELTRSREDVSLSIINAGHCPHDDNHVAANAAALEWLEGTMKTVF